MRPGRISRTVTLLAFGLLLALATSIDQTAAQVEPEEQCSQTETFFPNLLPISVGNAHQLIEVMTLEYGNPSLIFEVACAPDGRAIAVTGTVGISLYTSDTLDEPEDLSDTETHDVAFSGDSELLVFVDGDNIHLWDSRSNAELAVLNHTGVISVAFSPNGEILASGSGDGTIRLWELETYSVTTVLDSGFDNAVRDLVFSPSGDLLASGSQQGLHMWGMGEDLQMDADGPLKLQSILETQSTHSVAFSPDGTLLAAGIWYPLEDNPTLHVWEISSKEQIAHLLGNGEDTFAVAFSSAGDLLVSAGRDKAVTLWDVETSEELIALQGHTDMVWSVAFCSDDTLLVSAGVDGTVRFWGIPSNSGE